MKAKNFRKNQKGIGLIEVIAALGISVVVITSLVSLAIFTLRNSLYSTLQLEGTKIVNKQVEMVRAYRDSSVTTWEIFADDMSSCNTKCHMTSGSTPPVGDSDYINAGTTKEVEYYFTATAPDGSAVSTDTPIIRITATAIWQIGPKTQSTHVYTDLTNWQNK